MKHIPTSSDSPPRGLCASLRDKSLLVAAASLLAAASAQAQISIVDGTAVTQNFDGIGNTATAALPSGWKISPAGAIAPTWTAAGNFTATLQAANGGTPNTGSRYNWGNSATTSDRAVGFMTSGGYASPNSLMAQYTNNTGGTITDLAISFDIERYRVNTAAAQVNFFISTDGTTWTAQTAGDSGAFATGAITYTFNGGTVVNKSFSLTGLSIPTTTSFYLRWNFNTTGSNSQGLGLDNLSVAATFSGDTTAPTVSTLSPLNNATGVSTLTTLSAQFSETIAKGTGDITLKLVSDNSTVFTIPVTDAAVAVAGSTATITLPSSLAGLTGYYVNIASGAFKDLANNNFAGISDASTWTFTTASLDTTPPAISSTSPADDSSTAFPASNLVVSYNEPITAVSGSIVIKKVSDDSVVETISVPGAQVSVSGSSATINPSTILAYGTAYYVEITAGTFKDSANNGTLAVTGNSTWNFSTRAAPSVVISQYHEGTSSTDRYIELKNLTGAPINLSGYRLACWSDTPPSDNEGWKSGTSTTTRVTALTGTIPANGYFLVTEPGPVSPAYAANNFDLATDSVNVSATDFNGDDSVVLYSGTGFTQDEVVDAVSFTALQGENITFYRISDTIQGFDFVTGTSILNFTGTWATKTIAEVNSASFTDAWYLRAVNPPKNLALSISPASFSENGGSATATVSVAGPVAADLFINVDVNDASEATAGTLVTILAGQSSAQFPITAVNDPYLDGDQPVTVSVSAINYTPASQVITVQDELTDINLPVVINEVDADQAGTDTAEFIELYNTSSSAVSLDGVVIVLYNGNNDLAYSTINLSGKTIPANGYFVIGSANVASDLEAFNTDGIQNGADAVALYLGNPSEFPVNTPVTTTNGTLVDALVYDTADADDTELIGALTPGKPQINEGASGVSDTLALARVPNGGAAFDTSLYVAQTPTPGATNVIAGYSTWATTNAGGQTGNLDFDNDGVENGIEYFMNAAAGFTANPGVVAGAVTWTNGGNLLPADYGTKFYLQTSGNLSTWTNVASDAPGLVNNTGALTYTLPTGTGPLFVRLVVITP